MGTCAPVPSQHPLKKPDTAQSVAVIPALIGTDQEDSWYFLNISPALGSPVSQRNQQRMKEQDILYLPLAYVLIDMSIE